MRVFTRVDLLIVSLIFSGTLLAQSQQAIRDQLFGETDAVKREADALDARVLAPNSYAAGVELYINATETLEKGRDLERVRTDLVEARKHFERATETAKLAQVTFANVLAAREAAEQAGAPQYVERDWIRAEEALVAAAERLEDGQLNKAAGALPDVEQRYRDVEARSITAKTRGDK
jgi:OmpA-OmpF porin, OOP family